MKIFFAILICLSVFCSAQAQNVKYIPLEDVPGLPGGDQPVSFSSYLAAIYKVGIILAAILAVLMIVIGGIQYMMAAGNPGKLGDAKDTIWQAILGLLLVLGSWLILSTINPDLLKMEIGGATLNPATTAPTAPTTPAPATPVDNNFDYDPGIQAQWSDASPALQDLLNCMSSQVSGNIGRISSISDSRIAQGTCSFTSWTPSCSHAQNSCHYGGQNCSGKSYAVDFGDEQNYQTLKTTALNCQPGAYVLLEGNHTHISIGSANGCNCN